MLSGYQTYHKYHLGIIQISLVVVQVEAMKIHVAAVEALKKKERWDETQFTTKLMVFQVPHLSPPPKANVFF
jgi:hypothetical protein